LEDQADGIGVGGSLRSVTARHGLSVFERTGEQQGGVHHREDGIQLEIVSDLWPSECLHDGRWKCETGSLDQHVIDLILSASQALHDGEEIIVHGATDAAVREVMDFGAAIRVRGSQEGTIHGDLAELIDQHREATVRIFFQQTAEEGGFAGPEEAGDDGDGNFHGPGISSRSSG
jgi:hypothetical protein